MKFFRRGPLFIFALVLIWRVWLLVFTVQPIPASDAFGYDGGVVNFLHGGRYCNPSLALVFPISGTEIYATYPPLYQGALLSWMKLFGTSVVSAMGLHLVLFAVSGWLVLAIVRLFFPAATGYGLTALLFFGITFDDRPECLGYVFGLISLWMVMRQISEPHFRAGTAAGLWVSLLLGLYTSVIVGAYFFGIGFLACAAACLWRRNAYWFAPFIGVAVLFAVSTFAIARLEPLWWAGFLESARQQSVMTTGFRRPQAADVMKLVRTTPIFLLSLAAVPWVVARRKEILAQASAWLALVVAIFFMGWALLALSVTLLPANYFYYAVLTQVILAAGLLALAQKHFPEHERCLRAALLAGTLLVSVRAIAMSTWGVACAAGNSYQSTQAVLRAELEPFVKSDQPVLVSSPYLYSAAGLGVRNGIHSDWYFDHANWRENTQMDALARLKPAKLVLTQFDYYRNFEAVVAQLGGHPELVAVQVRDLARVRTPDSIPSMQRVVQHISWAPVIVDMNWKPPIAP